MSMSLCPRWRNRMYIFIYLFMCDKHRWVTFIAWVGLLTLVCRRFEPGLATPHHRCSLPMRHCGHCGLYQYATAVSTNTPLRSLPIRYCVSTNTPLRSLPICHCGLYQYATAVSTNTPPRYLPIRYCISTNTPLRSLPIRYLSLPIRHCGLYQYATAVSANTPLRPLGR